MKNTIVRFGLWAVLLAASFSPIASQAQKHHQSGIVGQTTLGQICETSGCFPRPVQSHLSIYLVRDPFDLGKFITEIATDEDGLFAVALKPGTYVLTPFIPRTVASSGVPVGGLVGGDTWVTVEKKQFAETLVRFDTPRRVIPTPIGDGIWVIPF